MSDGDVAEPETARWSDHLRAALVWRGRASPRELTVGVWLCLVLWGLSFERAFKDAPLGAAAALLLSTYVFLGLVIRRMHDAGRRGLRKAVSSLGFAYGVIGLVVVYDGPSLPASIAWIWEPTVFFTLLFWLSSVWNLARISPSHGANAFGPPPPWTPLYYRGPAPVLTPLQIKRVRERMQRAERMTLVMEPTTEPGGTRLGGDPDLEPAFAWPLGRDERPLAFMAQIDLAQARASGGPEWLPEQGGLFVFAAQDALSSRKDWAVIVRPAFEKGAPTPHDAPRFSERAVSMTALPSYPDLTWLGWLDEEISETDMRPEDEAALEAFGESAFAHIHPQHRLGGYPRAPAGAPLALICERGLAGETRPIEKAMKDYEAAAEQKVAARRWRLLLQLDADAQMGWRDRLYVFVREADARAGDFSQTWAFHAA